MTAGERKTRRGGSVQTVTISDGTGVLFCIWFNQKYVLKQFRSGLQVMISGRIQVHNSRRQLMHPDFEILDGQGQVLHTGRLVPVYPLTRGIGHHWLRQLIHNCLQQIPESGLETLPQELVDRRGLCSRQSALFGIHYPESKNERDAATKRLAYEEIFLVQMLMAIRRQNRHQQHGVKLAKPGDFTKRLVDSLPFRLTNAQRHVLAEILADMRSGAAMHRLLQGDVGCGKTLVALITALFVIEQGYQAVVMAPTEVLAQQHGKTMGRLVANLGIAVETLTGSTPAAQRRAIIAGAGQGEVDLLIGTHAVIQDTVVLPNLALAIVDEQHRFGVLQRGKSAQASKGELAQKAHVLVMSATPIPRSLSLTLYGDLDLSIVDELPAGRHPVETILTKENEIEEAWQYCDKKIEAGGQAFIVYPVIEQTEGQDLKAASVDYERLANTRFAHRRVALLHGKMKAPQKDQVMADFSAGKIDVLVATTVIEVGIDVPNANVMIIQNPERFGLAQLHQLRGRVGRGSERARCYLFCDRFLPQETYQRVAFFSTHNDGLELAEEDLRLRGPGEIGGIRQHGQPGFRLANPLRQPDLVATCAEDARKLLAGDPGLLAPAGRIVRQTLDCDYQKILPIASG